MASVCPSILTVPVPPEPISSSTAAIACSAAGVSSALPKANSTSAGSRITVFLVPPASAGPTAGHSTVPTLGSPAAPGHRRASVTRPAARHLRGQHPVDQHGQLGGLLGRRREHRGHRGHPARRHVVAVVLAEPTAETLRGQHLVGGAARQVDQHHDPLDLVDAQRVRRDRPVGVVRELELQGELVGSHPDQAQITRLHRQRNGPRLRGDPGAGCRARRRGGSSAHRAAVRVPGLEHPASATASRATMNGLRPARMNAPWIE